MGCSSSSSAATSTTMSSKPTIIFVLGAPGAGKGTQCDKIVQSFGYTHLSAGDLLRAERQTGSAVADEINHHIREGTIVPVAITVGLIEKAMTASGNDKFLIDGFPRNKDNLDGWESIMGEKVNVKFMLFLDATEDQCVERCLKRGQGRVDDTKETLVKRFRTFKEETQPIVGIFEKRGLVRQVDGMRSVDEVFADIQKLFA